MTRLKHLVNAFARDEDGAALTEYVVLLGIMTAAVITAVALFGTNLAAAWDAWANWIDTSVNPPAAPGG